MFMSSKLGSGKMLAKKTGNIRRLDSPSCDLLFEKNRVKHTKNKPFSSRVDVKPKLDPSKQNQPLITHITNIKESLKSGWSVPKVVDLDLEVRKPINVFDCSFPIRKSNSL